MVTVREFEPVLGVALVEEPVGVGGLGGAAVELEGEELPATPVATVVAARFVSTEPE